jgi:hypothetical protein
MSLSGVQKLRCDLNRFFDDDTDPRTAQLIPYLTNVTKQSLCFFEPTAMLINGADAAYNPLSGYAYEGVWEKYDEPALRRWIWTVKDSTALLVLAGITLLISITQTRTWVIARYIIRTRKSIQPARLQDENSPEPLQYLSQGRAILQVLPFAGTGVSRLRRKAFTAIRGRKVCPAEPLEGNDPALSPWFGAVALLTVAVFITMGIMVPWLLTYGATEAPVVKSRATDSCLKSEKYSYIPIRIYTPPKSDAIFSQCLDRLDAGCDTRFYLQQPTVLKERIEYCPFPGNICHNQIKPLQITHVNVTPLQMGVNSKSKISFNHRLTCAPVDLDPFLLFTRNAPKKAWISARNWDLHDGSRLWRNFSMPLNTMNGPNKLSTENSGLRMAQERGPNDLTVLPRHWAGVQVVDDPNALHKALQRDDGLAYLVIYRAGPIAYNSPVDDPFFAADNPHWLNLTDRYFANREATALACFETSQYCEAEHALCTPWGRGSSQVSQVMKYLGLSLEELAEGVAFLKLLPSFFSVYNHLSEGIEWHHMMPLRKHSAKTSKSFALEGNEAPWTLEVETWFRKAILSAILVTSHGAHVHLRDYAEIFRDSSPGVREYIINNFSLCGRILFRDGNYTNINWIGLWLTISTLGFICLLSLSREIYMGGKAVWGALPGAFVKLAVLGQTVKLVVSRSDGQQGQNFSSWVARFLGSHRPFSPPGFQRPWSGKQQRRSPAASNSELHDLES